MRGGGWASTESMRPCMAELMFDSNVGVAVRRTYELKSLDDDFFDAV